jgi:hypothetical protein
VRQIALPRFLDIVIAVVLIEGRHGRMQKRILSRLRIQLTAQSRGLMGKVVCTLKTKPNPLPKNHAAMAWVELSTTNKIQLTDAGADIPPGNYVLHWKLQGETGDMINVTLDAVDPVTQKPCTTGDQIIPPGKVFITSVMNAPKGYKPKHFEVK